MHAERLDKVGKVILAYENDIYQARLHFAIIKTVEQPLAVEFI